MIRRLFRRRPDAALIRWSPWSALEPERPLLAEIRDARTGQLLARDTHAAAAEWLRLRGFRPVVGPSGIHVKQ